VFASPALEDVLAGTTLESVLARLAIELVLALAAVQGVLARTAANQIVAGEAGELVVPAQAYDHIPTGRALADVAAVRADDGRRLALAGRRVEGGRRDLVGVHCEHAGAGPRAGPAPTDECGPAPSRRAPRQGGSECVGLRTVAGAAYSGTGDGAGPRAAKVDGED